MILFQVYQILILQKVVFHMTLYIVVRAAFYDRLENLLSCDCIDTVLGDFNIDILNRANISLQQILSIYTLLVNELTQ